MVSAKHAGARLATGSSMPKCKVARRDEKLLIPTAARRLNEFCSACWVHRCAGSKNSHFSLASAVLSVSCAPALLGVMPAALILRTASFKLFRIGFALS